MTSKSNKLYINKLKIGLTMMTHPGILNLFQPLQKLVALSPMMVMKIVAEQKVVPKMIMLVQSLVLDLLSSLSNSVSLQRYFTCQCLEFWRGFLIDYIFYNFYSIHFIDLNHHLAIIGGFLLLRLTFFEFIYLNIGFTRSNIERRFMYLYIPHNVYSIHFFH